ncbi:cytidylyltransferase domain-containing protein [Treponema sp. OMZ 857]|uniref:acylneuraminate cytidylyltransferase family protein n=1 Tax=Treponema sp. OMZ 857 TaxID=1643513 RepID=UPI0020A30A4C|nr:acylneuraminate cytidylyltransferase family protein [Treponema sp. OMZ 857]UTC44453.1 acylneuraminate cytidylyltransferase family protein [Treponema sp. OMZ 857]
MYNNNKILCTICARGGSKGVKGKNFKLINGKPLIAYTIETALQLGVFDHIVVSSDSKDIQNIAVKYGAEVFFTRPAELASDNAAKIPVIRHAFIESEKYYNDEYDILVDLDATSPLRTIDDIKACIDLLIEKKSENVITAMPSRRSPYFNLIERDSSGWWNVSKKLEKEFVRRQDTPSCYDMNASIYVWTRDSILHNDSVFNATTELYVMPEERSIDIDSELDFQFVEFLLNQKK